jgi:hypothetical protein
MFLAFVGVLCRPSPRMLTQISNSKLCPSSAPHHHPAPLALCPSVPLDALCPSDSSAIHTFNKLSGFSNVFVRSGEGLRCNARASDGVGVREQNHVRIADLLWK